jgi:diadenosine tetraphosphate (Ap4A) HIT family hydrolase
MTAAVRKKDKTSVGHMMRTLKRHAREEDKDPDDYISELFESLRVEQRQKGKVLSSSDNKK